MTAGFWYAWSFLTRFPSPRAPLVPAASSHALAYFPLVGAALGAVGAAGLLGLGVLWGSWLSAALALAGYCWCTGGLHLDGWADTVDGWSASHADPQRGLEVMRDSRIGAHGASALVLLLLVKLAALHALASASPGVVIGAWIMAASLARCAAAAALLHFPSARAGGWGASLRAATRRRAWWALAPWPCVLLGAWWVWGSRTGAAWAALTLVVVTGLVAFTASRWARLWGGLTGDHYGALIELGETAGLVTWCAYE